MKHIFDFVSDTVHALWDDFALTLLVLMLAAMTFHIGVIAHEMRQLVVATNRYADAQNESNRISVGIENGENPAAHPPVRKEAPAKEF